MERLHAQGRSHEGQHHELSITHNHHVEVSCIASVKGFDVTSSFASPSLTRLPDARPHLLTRAGRRRESRPRTAAQGERSEA